MTKNHKWLDDESVTTIGSGTVKEKCFRCGEERTILYSASHNTCHGQSRKPVPEIASESTTEPDG